MATMVEAEGVHVVRVRALWKASRRSRRSSFPLLRVVVQPAQIVDADASVTEGHCPSASARSQTTRVSLLLLVRSKGSSA
jgi:hypothetical protein